MNMNHYKIITSWVEFNKRYPNIEDWEWKEDISKHVWGNISWNWFHLLAINYRPNNYETTFNKILKFIHKLPCQTCREHALEYIVIFMPDLTNSKHFQKWVWKFHNTVNFKLNKKLITYDDYKKLYNLY